ncbi:hypothetical protein L7F22_053393 [Adiantum nelumboides]|nr:hypothetical protein [Adiantum nelumboides]
MATRGLLHHPLHARPPSYIADRHVLRRRPSFPSDVTLFGRRLPSTFTLRSLKCMKMEDQADARAEARDTPQVQLDSSNTDAVEYVNKTSPGPMVEVDPVTVFRRIVAERRASFATRAKQQSGDGTIIQSTAPNSFIRGNKGSGKSTIAIALAFIFLVLAAVLYFQKARSDREKQIELSSKEEKDIVDVASDNGRHKLVKDTIKAPDSVLMAMAIGAASVGRFKGQTGLSQDTTHGGNGNLVDTHGLAGGADVNPGLNTAEMTNTDDITTKEDKETEGHEIPTFEQVSYNPSNTEASGIFKTQNAGIDVPEGPWFAQAADDACDPHPEAGIDVPEGPWFAQAADDACDPHPEAGIQSPFYENVVTEDVLAQKHAVHVSTEAMADKFVGKIPVSEVRYETLPLNNVVDGEFLGEVVSVSVPTEEAVETSDNTTEVEAFEFEESEDKTGLTDSSAYVEKLEQIIGQESITTAEGKNMLGEADVLEHNLLPDLPALGLLNDQVGTVEMDAAIDSTDSDSDDSENDEEHELTQFSTPVPMDKVASVEESDSEIEWTGQDSITTAENKNVVGEADALEQNLLANIQLPALEHPNDQTDTVDMGTAIGSTDSDTDESESDEQLEVTQALTPLPMDKVAFMEENESKVDVEGEGKSLIDVEEHGDSIELLSGIDQTLERIETELDDASHSVSLPADDSEAGKVNGAFSVGPNCSDDEVASWTSDEPLSASHTSEEAQTDGILSLGEGTYHDPGAMAHGSTAYAGLQSLEEDIRGDNKKALEAALPALAIGVGTVGTLFGVAGGLQVVGFAAVANFFSKDFFWAESREDLFQELKGISNRQQLMNFLVRRNIVTKEDQEESSF